MMTECAAMMLDRQMILRTVTEEEEGWTVVGEMEGDDEKKS